MIRQLLSVCLVGLVFVSPPALDAQVPASARADSTSRAQPAPVDSALAAQGRVLADQYACHACHAYTASEPKTMGPSLNGVFQRRGAAYLDQKIAEPQFDDPKSQMPKLPLTASQRRAIVEFMRTLN
jgi:cytochrome c551/c552